MHDGSFQKDMTCGSHSRNEKGSVPLKVSENAVQISLVQCFHSPRDLLAASGAMFNDPPF